MNFVRKTEETQAQKQLAVLVFRPLCTRKHCLQHHEPARIVPSCLLTQEKYLKHACYVRVARREGYRC